jgi:hypothetical protein
MLGIFNSSLELVTPDQSYNFCSFQDRDTAYDRIFALWKISSPHAKNVTGKQTGDESKSNSPSPIRSAKDIKKGNNTRK